MNKGFDLTGKTVLVTGGSRGLGRAMALALAEAGCDVAVNARTEAGLQEVLGAIKKLGRKAVALPGDVSDEEEVQRMVEGAVKGLGRIDILLNNAGLWEGSYLVRLTKADWDKVIQVNLTGAFLIAKAVGKVMLKQRSGKIINTSSILGFKSSPQSLVYAATKAALIQMTKVIALELGPAGIRVNAIAPGFFETDMTKRYHEPDAQEALEAYISRIPLRKTGRPEDLAGLIVFLASSASDHITGQTLVIDGGESLV